MEVVISTVFDSDKNDNVDTVRHCLSSDFLALRLSSFELKFYAFENYTSVYLVSDIKCAHTFNVEH